MRRQEGVPEFGSAPYGDIHWFGHGHGRRNGNSLAIHETDQAFVKTYFQTLVQAHVARDLGEFGIKIDAIN